MNKVSSKARLSPRLSLLYTLFILASLIAATQAWALDPLVNLRDYRHDTWRKKDGAPGNISSMAQTKDGWLWLGTSHGLYRFDGITFERFLPPSGRKLRGLRISTMLAAQNGDLLVAYYEGGFDLIRDGDLQKLPNADKAPPEVVFSIAKDIDGSVWIGTKKGLIKYVGGNWQTNPAEWGLPAKLTENVVLDSQHLCALVGGIWYRLDRSTQHFVATNWPAEVELIYSPNGNIWQVHGPDIVRLNLDEQGTQQAGFPAYSNTTGEKKSMFDRDGNLWLLEEPNGVTLVRKQDVPLQDRFAISTLPSQRLDQPWQLSSLTTNFILEDREGNVWISTGSGIEKFSNQNIRTMAMSPGTIGAVPIADWAGNIWVGAGNLDQLWNVSANKRPPQSVQKGPMQNSIGVRGHGGAFVVNTPSGIERRYPDRIELLPMPDCPDPSILTTSMLVEDHVSTWVSIMPCGVFRYINGKWHDANEYGIPQTMRNMNSAPDGSVWFLTPTGEAWRFKDERLKLVATADVGAARIIDVQKDVLVSGSTGTSVLKGSQFERLSSHDQDALRYLSGIMITANGDRWLHGFPGLMHVTSTDWIASMNDPQIPLRVRTYGTRDGYPGETILSQRSNGAIDANGKLWFIGSDGIGVLNPNSLYRNRVAPVVQISDVKVDGQIVPVGDQLHLKDSSAKIEIHFAALSLTAPEQMKVLFRLEGDSNGWQEVGRARHVSYTDLAPGSYRFMVKAASAEGIWSEQDASVKFDVVPRFTQTIWFYLLCAIGIAALGYMLYVIRMRHVVGRLNALLSARLMERERIARALHDSWLQEVHGLVLNFSVVSNGLPVESNSRVRMEELLNRADTVLVNGRNAVMGLRAAAVQSDDIERAFDSLGQRLRLEHGAIFSLHIRGAIRTLDHTAWEEIYYVGYEALHNAYRHAKARRITLTVYYGVDRFTLTVRDDGMGLPPEILRDGAREGHFGMIGMRERAEIVGGTIELLNPNGCGTEIRFSIPSNYAYAIGTRAGWLARLRGHLRELIRQHG